MVPAIKPDWSKPSTILFASEFPANEKAFTFALAQAKESDADLIIFHAYQNLARSASVPFKGRNYADASACAIKHCFQSLAQRAANLGIRCQIVIRPGLPADAIPAFACERKFDRIIMGARTPGPVGRHLVGSVAETMLRTSPVPVNFVGPHVMESSFRNLATRTVLCSVSAQQSSHMVACFAAELADRLQAQLILQHVIPPQECSEAIFGRTFSEIKKDLFAMVPSGLQHRLSVQTSVMRGDPAEELLYQGRVLKANLIVMGAQGASHFAAITHAGSVYKVLAYAHCPVITLSPVLLAESGAYLEIPHPVEFNYMAGVF